MKNPELLHTASEQFLGKKEHEIKSTVLQTLEGHLRAILGTLTVEEVYKDRDQFASLVREVAAPDVGRMGIEILSFTIKDVYDNVTYLQSLGKAQTAAVKRDAEIGVAQVKCSLIFLFICGSTLLLFHWFLKCLILIKSDCYISPRSSSNEFYGDSQIESFSQKMKNKTKR